MCKSLNIYWIGFLLSAALLVIVQQFANSQTTISGQLNRYAQVLGIRINCGVTDSTDFAVDDVRDFIVGDEVRVIQIMGTHIVRSMRGEGQQGIMAPRGTLVDAPFTYSPRSGDTKIKPGGTASNTLDPVTRRVTPGNIHEILGTVSFDEGGKATIGNPTKRIVDANGKPK